ncbi:MAG: AAA family ATPase [Syntrophales bacterium]|nr:hypothetical protein [Deltaproteobacteria bacterium]
MMLKELDERNPLGQLKLDLEALRKNGTFGAVMAPAGVGKTALLVQIALQAMVRKSSVFYVSLQDPIQKVTLWYDEILQDLGKSMPPESVSELREKMLLHRFIMTFREDNFTVPKLAERLNDLIVQNIFQPHILIIDGLYFDEKCEGVLKEMKTLACERGLFVWFSIHIHRNEQANSSGIPLSVEGLEQYFQVLLKIDEKNGSFFLKTIKGGDASRAVEAEPRLDPTTMLIAT